MTNGSFTRNYKVIKYSGFFDPLFPASVAAVVPFTPPQLHSMPIAPSWIPDTPVINGIDSLTASVPIGIKGPNQSGPGVRYPWYFDSYNTAAVAVVKDVQWGTLPTKQVPRARRDVNSGPSGVDSLDTEVTIAPQMDISLLPTGQSIRIVRTRRQPVPNQDAVLSVTSPCVWVPLSSATETWTLLNTNPC